MNLPGIDCSMDSEQQFLISLLVKIGMVAATASILVRWSAVKRMLLREERTFHQRLLFGLWLGGIFSVGVVVRIFLQYRAADISLEGALVAGLLGGYVSGALAGLLIGLPAFANHEILAVPLMVGVGGLGGFLRDLAPDPEDVWRFSPFFDLSIWRWFRQMLDRAFEAARTLQPLSPAGLLHDRRGPSAAYQMLLLFACVSLEFLRILLGHLFGPGTQKLFYLYPAWPDPPWFTVAAPFLTTVACVALPLKVWNNTRNEIKLEEQRRLLMQAKLDALSSQINPHFLFNTLNSVASLIRSDQEKARLLVFKLSTILRRLLRKHDNFSPLRDELEFIDDYLSIEVIRFGEKLRIVKEIDEPALDALVPSMMLQPILENSIRHGLSPKVEGGTIFLRAACADGRLTLTIEDDGIGIPAELMANIYNRGIGVSNVRERLTVLFGPQYRMQIDSQAGRGTRVEIEIPELHDTLYAAGGVTLHSDRERPVAARHAPSLR
jgi:two-component system LytT family sensor kinase